MFGFGDKGPCASDKVFASALQMILEKLNRIEKNQEKIMLDLTKLTADVAAETAVDQSAIVLLTALKAEVDAIPTSTDPTTQAAIDAISKTLETGTAGLAAAVAANTPAQVSGQAPAA